MYSNRKTFFVSSEKILVDVVSFFQKLQDGEIKNKDLLKDFQTYGKESFRLYIFDTDFELEDESGREELIKNYYEEFYCDKIYQHD